MFSREDVKWLSDSVQLLYAARTPSEFAKASMTALDGRFDLMTSTCEEVSPDISTYFLHRLRSSIAVPTDCAAYLHDNPLKHVIASQTACPVLHLQQHTTPANWKRTEHFNGIARPMGWNDQFLVVSQARPSLVVIGAYRDRVFSPLESSLMQFLQPHIMTAWRRVKNPEPGRIHLGSLRVALCKQNKPLHLSETHRLIFKGYFPHWLGTDELPPQISTWLTHSIQGLSSRPPLPLRTFMSESARGRLLIRCFISERDSSIELVMIETPATPDFFQLRRVGLTTRQCEVVYWIAQGKRDAEIAAIIACASGTVSKHVENILVKLGAETRTACIARARTILSGQF